MDVEQIKANHPIEVVCEHLGLTFTTPPGGTRATKCYAHEDNHPSLVIMPEANRYECKSCGEAGDTIDLIQKVRKCAFKEALEWLEPENRFTSNAHDVISITPQDYIQGHGITPETLQRFNIRVEDKRIVIPLPTGEKYLMPGQDPKWLNKRGTEATLFKTDTKEKAVILCEGEFDAMRIWQETGFPAWSGTAGCKTFKQEWVGEFDKLEAVYVAYDNDTEGRTGALKVMEMLGDKCKQIEVPKDYGKDWCDFFNLGNNKIAFSRLLTTAKTQGQPKLYSSGFDRVDASIGGFKSPGTYCIGGYEKSGKSTFLISICKNFIKNGTKVGYLDTELNKSDIINTLVAADLNIGIDEVEAHPEYAQEWESNHGENLLYAGISDLTNERDAINFDLMANKAREFIAAGAEVLVWDNLTTISLTGKDNGWTDLARSGITVINMAKKYKVLCFVVVHTKSQTVYNQTPDGLRSILKSDKPLKIFEDSVTVVLKPTGVDLYGGGAWRSQLNGTLILWRPFQLIASEELSPQGMFIFENFRGTQPKANVRFLFDGGKKSFLELGFQNYEIKGEL